MKRKEAKTGKITIDKLAILMNSSFKSLEKKMATKEDLKNLEEKMATKEGFKTQQDVLQTMLKEITAIHKDSKSFRENISTLYTDHVAYDLYG